MKNSSIHYSIILPFGLLMALFSFLQWDTKNADSKSILEVENQISSEQDLIEVDFKQRGAHVFGIGDSTGFQPLIQSNLEWITMVSWGFQDDYDSPNVTHHDGDSVYLKQHNAHWIIRIELVRAAGFRVFSNLISG